MGGTKEGPLCPPPAGQHRPRAAHLLISSLIASQLGSGGVHGITERFGLEVISKTTNFQRNLSKPHFFPQTQPCQTHQPAPRTCSNQFQEGDVLLQEGQRLGKHKEPPAPADSQLFHLEIGGARLSWQQSGRCIAGREPGRKHSSPLVVHFPKPTGCVPK